jgi:hypothetical protein
MAAFLKFQIFFNLFFKILYVPLRKAINMYSSIKKKPCKCGCGKPPTIGFKGYNHLCKPEFKKDILERQKRREVVKLTSRKLRATMEPENEEKIKAILEEKQRLDKWFPLIRKKLTGVCQCGCGKPSSKNDDKYYKFSCCHLFPKSIFKSILDHPDNYLERAFWGGCHTNMDEAGMLKWKDKADWEQAKEKFHLLAPLLTDKERSHKFYRNLESLIYYGKLAD